MRQRKAPSGKNESEKEVAEKPQEAKDEKKEISLEERKRKYKEYNEKVKLSEKRSRYLLAGSLIFILANAFMSTKLWNKFGYYLKECKGEICSLEGVELDRECGPWDTNRLIYVRIPKTGSTSIHNTLLKSTQPNAIPVKSLGEWFDAVPNIVVDYIPPMSTMEGYIDNPRKGLIPSERMKFYEPIAHKVVRPGHVYNRSYFEGHIFHLEWAEARGVFKYPKVLDNVPGVRDFLFPIPTIEELKKIEEISFMRKPANRLTSMYNYDRTMARTQLWRENFIEKKGDKSFEECLLDPECVQTNELRRWCSLQTEFLCGLHPDCNRPLTEKALTRAKNNVQNKILFVGLLERLPESFQILEALLPIYFEKLTEHKIPHKMRTPEYDQVSNPKAKAILKEICSLDDQLYTFVEQLMNKRQKKCGFQSSFL